MTKNLIFILTVLAMIFATGCSREKGEGGESASKIDVSAAGSGDTGTILIEVENLGSSNGGVIASLFNSKKGFPINMKKAIRRAESQGIHSGRPETRAT